MLWQVLDKVISLDQCDVYAYTPDLESDPHAEDSDEDTESDDSSASEDEAYDFVGLDELASTSPPKLGMQILGRSPYGRWADDTDDFLAASYHSSSSSPDRARMRRTTGGLLWSSHHFFYNRKLKRILFVSIWAKKRRRWSGGSDEGAEEDSFVGWQDGVGAGARAMGLGSDA